MKVKNSLKRKVIPLALLLAVGMVVVVLVVGLALWNPANFRVYAVVGASVLVGAFAVVTQRLED